MVYFSRHPFRGRKPLARRENRRQEEFIVEEPRTVPKKSKSPRISESQLQAYRNRRASAPVIVPADGKPAAETTGEHAAAVTTSWGRVDEEYAMIRADLIRLLIIAALMLGLIFALSFVLG